MGMVSAGMHGSPIGRPMLKVMFLFFIYWQDIKLLSNT